MTYPIIKAVTPNISPIERITTSLLVLVVLVSDTPVALVEFVKTVPPVETSCFQSSSSHTGDPTPIEYEENSVVSTKNKIYREKSIPMTALWCPAFSNHG